MDPKQVVLLLEQQIKECERMLLKYDGILQYCIHLRKTLETTGENILEKLNAVPMEASQNGQSGN